MEKNNYPSIEGIVVSPPITTIFWSDKTYTVVKCGNEPFDEEKGVLFCVAKKFLGSTTSVLKSIDDGKEFIKNNFGKLKSSK